MITERFLSDMEDFSLVLNSIKTDFKKFDRMTKEEKLSLIEEACQRLRKINYIAHSFKHHIEWSEKPIPEWYDHFCDMYYQFSYENNSHWVERGVFSNLAIKPGASVLELCCGDGFNAHHFYSTRAESVIAIDFNEKAIAHAKRNFGHNPKVTFLLADIRTGIPNRPFNNIVWDAAIEHFTKEEIEKLLLTMKNILGERKGILSGQTIKDNNTGSKQLEHHEYEFKSAKDVEAFLKKHFHNVLVFETVHPERHNLYFYASDGSVPFLDQGKK